MDTNLLEDEYFTIPPVLPCAPSQPPARDWSSSTPETWVGAGSCLAWARPHFLVGATEFGQTSSLSPTLGEDKARTPQGSDPAASAAH